MRGFRVLEVPVNHRPRRFGESKYGIGNRVFKAFVDLLVVRWMKDRLAALRGGRGSRRNAGAAAVRVLLIGLGRWGEKHLRVLTELGVELWVADVAEERRAFAIKAGVARERAVADYREALPHVEAVDLVTPADSHLAVAGDCLRAGRHCFVEKPLTLTVAEGRELAALVRSTGRVLQVGHIFRFHPVTIALRERLASGGVGPVRYCTGRFAGFKRPRTDVGVTQTDAIHYFDLFAHLLGTEATAVTATLRDHLGRGMDDLVLLHGGVRARCPPSSRPATLRRAPTAIACVVGERATLAADFGSAEVAVHDNRHVHGRGRLAGVRRARSRPSRPPAPSPCASSSSCSWPPRARAGSRRWT